MNGAKHEVAGTPQLTGGWSPATPVGLDVVAATVAPPSGTIDGTRFAHASEAEMARILDFYAGPLGVRTDYLPHPLESRRRGHRELRAGLLPARARALPRDDDAEAAPRAQEESQAATAPGAVPGHPDQAVLRARLPGDDAQVRTPGAGARAVGDARPGRARSGSRRGGWRRADPTKRERSRPDRPRRPRHRTSRRCKLLGSSTRPATMDHSGTSPAPRAAARTRSGRRRRRPGSRAGAGAERESGT